MQSAGLLKSQYFTISQHNNHQLDQQALSKMLTIGRAVCDSKKFPFEGFWMHLGDKLSIKGEALYPPVLPVSHTHPAPGLQHSDTVWQVKGSRSRETINWTITKASV